MKILDYCVICTADDEEPDCMVCDYCHGNDLCSECRPGRPEHWWHYYEREEQDSKMSRLIIALKKIRLKEVNYDK